MNKNIKKSKITNKINVKRQFEECDIEKLFDDVEIMKQSLNTIEKCLLGDRDFQQMGVIEKVNCSYEYAKKNIDSKLVVRAEKALDHFFDWEKNGYWGMLSDMLDKYKAIKWLSLLLGSSTIVSIATLVMQFIRILGGKE